MQYTIVDRGIGKPIVTVEIDCAEDAAESGKRGLAAQAALRAHVNLTGADLTGARLAGANLIGRANLIDACLAGANLAGADLTGAYLFNANLADARLVGANLADARLVGANLAHTEGVADLGQDRRGYRFIAVQNAEHGYMIAAGCRWFTPAVALTHWSQAHRDDPALRADCLARVEMARVIAEANGWVTTDAPIGESQ